MDILGRRMSSIWNIEGRACSRVWLSNICECEAASVWIRSLYLLLDD